MDVVNLSIKDIRLDFQPREYYDEEKVWELTAAMRRGDSFPPVVVYYDGESYWLADGFHRVAAALSIGGDKIDAEVVPGTYADLCAKEKQMWLDIGRALEPGGKGNHGRV